MVSSSLGKLTICSFGEPYRHGSCHFHATTKYTLAILVIDSLFVVSESPYTFRFMCYTWLKIGFCDPHFWENLQTRSATTAHRSDLQTQKFIFYSTTHLVRQSLAGKVFFSLSNCQGVPQTLQQSGQTLNSQVRQDLKTSLAGPTTDHQAPYPHTNIPGDRLTSFYFRNLFFGLTIPVFPSLRTGIPPSHPVTYHQNPLLFSEFTL